MKNLFLFSAAFLVLSSNTYAASSEPGKFEGCAVKGECVSDPCEKYEIEEKRDIIPLVGCEKIMRLNKETKTYEFYYYRIAVKAVPYSKSLEECKKNKDCGQSNGAILLRIR
jgi:hypothetical protein